MVEGITLVSTLHDPEKMLSRMIAEYGSSLKQVFRSLVVTVSPNTHRHIVRLLEDTGIKILICSENVVETYKTALRSGLDENAQHLMYCDFDRALHWVRTYPLELSRIAGILTDYDFLMLGRTQRAFKTHPETQTKTESIANQLGSKILGFKQPRDIMSATWGLSDPVGEFLLKTPYRNKYGFYCEWPIVAWHSAKKHEYIEVEGLEWETPDRYKEAVKERGYEVWLRDLQSPREWKRRNEVLSECVSSVLKYI